MGRNVNVGSENCDQKKFFPKNFDFKNVTTDFAKMNLKVPPDQLSSSSSDEDSSEEKRIENKGFSNWTQNVNLFILVFFAGVLSASVVAISVFTTGNQRKSYELSKIPPSATY